MVSILAALRKFRNANISNKKRASLQIQCSSTKDDIINQQPDDILHEDIISQLPDEILVSIISRIPIKSAIRTSILSKRWRNLHKLLSGITLDLLHRPCYDDDEIAYSNLIMDSLDKFLRLRSGSKIRYFHLLCRLDKSVTERLEQCVCSIGRSGVENLILSFWFSRGLSFSCHLLTELPSLRHLSLTSCSLQPSSKSHCDSLKTLRLSEGKLIPGAIECVLSNCLTLQLLFISRCRSPVKLSFRGASLQLKALSVRFCQDVEAIDIYASNLVAFDFTNSKKVDIVFDHIPLLQSLYVYIYREDIVSYIGREISKDLPHLESLNFGTRGDILQAGRKPMEINVFRNLRRLDFSVFSMERTNLLLLTPLLQSCPVLQEFHLHTFLLSEYDAPQEKEPAIVFHSELKKMEISGFVGTENDIRFAVYILKSATGLDQMLITRKSKTYHGCGSWYPHETLMQHERYCVCGRFHREPETPWSEERLGLIHRRLQGQAVSEAAQLIIRQKAEPQFNWPYDWRGVEEIDIYASNLVVFEFMNSRKVNFKFDHVPQLQSVYLYIPRKDIVPYVGWKISQDLPHLKSLNFGIRGDIFQASSKPMEINIFGNLSRLDISLYSTQRIDLLLVTPLLQCCPLLQEFQLHTFLPEHDVQLQGNGRAVVFHSELKKMEISGFIGTENDIQFAQYVLKCAAGLEQMVISRHSKTYLGCGWWCPQHETPWSEESKIYHGCGCGWWCPQHETPLSDGRHRMIHKQLHETPWSEERHRMIQRQLQGQAVSKAANVIIRQKAHVEHNWPGDCSVSVVL